MYDFSPYEITSRHSREEHDNQNLIDLLIMIFVSPDFNPCPTSLSNQKTIGMILQKYCGFHFSPCKLNAPILIITKKKWIPKWWLSFNRGGLVENTKFSGLNKITNCTNVLNCITLPHFGLQSFKLSNLILKFTICAKLVISLTFV